MNPFFDSAVWGQMIGEVEGHVEVKRRRNQTSLDDAGGGEVAAVMVEKL